MKNSRPEDVGFYFEQKQLLFLHCRQFKAYSCLTKDRGPLGEKILDRFYPFDVLWDRACLANWDTEISLIL